MNSMYMTESQLLEEIQELEVLRDKKELTQSKAMRLIELKQALATIRRSGNESCY